LILHHIGHLLNQDIVLLYACSWALAQIRESIDGTIVHHFMIASTVQILLQSVASWGNLVGGSKWNPTQEPHTWADMGSAIASVDLYCPVEVVGLAALLRPAEGVGPVDLQRLVEVAGPLGFQHSAEEAGLAGFAMAVEH
jgi:hypothetical protein